MEPSSARPVCFHCGVVRYTSNGQFCILNLAYLHTSPRLGAECTSMQAVNRERLVQVVFKLNCVPVYWPLFTRAPHRAISVHEGSPKGEDVLSVTCENVYKGQIFDIRCLVILSDVTKHIKRDIIRFTITIGGIIMYVLTYTWLRITGCKRIPYLKSAHKRYLYI